MEQPRSHLAIASGPILVGAEILRDVDVGAPGTVDFSFSAADQGSLATVPPFTLPAGITQANFFTFFRTPGVTMPLACGSPSGGTYYTVPAAAAMTGDHYVGVALGTSADRIVYRP